MIRYKPKIDKISITVPITEPALQKLVINGINDLAEGGKAHLYLTVKGGGYAAGVIIVLPMALGFKQGTLMRVQAGANSEQKNFMRFEWNPASVGIKGLTYLKQEFGDFLPDWQERIKETGRVTRVDIACDFNKIKVDDIVAWSNKVQKFGLFTNADGETETLYLGDKKSNQVVIYDRVAALVAKNKAEQNKHDTVAVLEPVPKYPVTRIERRLRKDSTPVATLKDLANPFSGVKIYHPNPDQFPASTYNYPAFRNMVQMRGFKRAVASLPPSYRAKYEKKMLSYAAKWWDADNVWKHWPHALKKAGLLTP